MHRSREGWHWTPTSGLQAGIPSVAVVEPSRMIQHSEVVLDVIVIGAGYAGLTAARDTSTAGLQTLLLEGRDRLGGRTWSSEIEGYPYEMGGTWVHWFQPHVYRELSRYGMKDQMVQSTDYSKKHNFFTFKTAAGVRNMSHKEEDSLFARAVEKFVNVDGNLGRTVMPFPFNAHSNGEVFKYANLSVADRISQISHDLSSDERHAVEAFVLLCSGGTTENSAFLDFLRWWAAANYDYKTLLDTIIVYKLKCGQSGFAKRFFDESVASGNLSYSFNTAVARIDSSKRPVEVWTKDGRHFSATRVICTAPLNVLGNIGFNPPLDQAKREAIALKHVNQCVKVHADIKDPELRSWSGVTYPHNKLVIAVADGTTAAGKTHCVFFGGDVNHMHADEDINQTLQAIREFGPMEIDRVRRIKCDQSRPKCNKCLRKGLDCPGYGIRYRFNDGIASRGRFTGRAVPIDQVESVSERPEQKTTPFLLWPDGSTTSTLHRFSPASTSRDFEDNELTSDGDHSLPTFPVDTSGGEEAPRALPVAGTFTRYSAESTFEPTACLLSDSIHRDGVCHNEVPKALQPMGAQYRELFAHFSSTIAPVMVVLDGKFNGYRDLILPIAFEDQLVRSAVCVVAMHHLAHQRPGLQSRAEAGFQAIISELRLRTSTQLDLVDIFAWTTIIILLTGETITGGTNLPYLFKILQHLAAANARDGRESVMHSFLMEQTRMMTLFAQPLLGESAGTLTLSARPAAYFDFISNAAIFHPTLAPQIGVYKAAIHMACNIYLKRVTSGPPHYETVVDLERLKSLCEQIHPATPGHHTLVWVYFIAAAESSTLEHREFFTMRLQEVFSRTRFHNIPTALAALQEFWKVQSERRWTEILPEIMPVFII
ncbi:uncharacterized protein Z520_09019 [Fonsecaea multimorphosa CBS 102226]|uniref:Amine oxidase domain-containing protein n=1 Tax=Fonsecaea multimorphosa CBS 102226 TaxID=1442371 RepID=A0A0D2KEF8_9EURO|nr:uncharacterized protein Z520_09019 [Fonsecaea multimorphosa CBS 102226]KIX95103.1 hypothetical protein Z520_09019 [Fonsecaea multimorphosa CBS 102226]